MACKMKGKQLSRELDISRTSKKVSYFPFGPGPLHGIFGQSQLPSHSPLLLFSWSEPDRHTWEKCIHARKNTLKHDFCQSQQKKAKYNNANKSWAENFA